MISLLVSFLFVLEGTSGQLIVADPGTELDKDVVVVPTPKPIMLNAGDGDAHGDQLDRDTPPTPPPTYTPKPDGTVCYLDEDWQKLGKIRIPGWKTIDMKDYIANCDDCINGYTAWSSNIIINSNPERGGQPTCGQEPAELQRPWYNDGHMCFDREKGPNVYSAGWLEQNTDCKYCINGFDYWPDHEIRCGPRSCVKTHDKCVTEWKGEGTPWCDHCCADDDYSFFGRWCGSGLFDGDTNCANKNCHGRRRMVEGVTVSDPFMIRMDEEATVPDLPTHGATVPAVADMDGVKLVV